jgi:hypothetical protein
MAMDTGRTFYPDANFTMRVAFGKVEGYKAADAVYYTSTSTLQGIMEKEDPDIADYRVLPGLRELYEKRDFGPWSDNGKMPVCFSPQITSGGNPGSPVQTRQASCQYQFDELGRNGERLCYDQTLPNIS